MKLNNLLDPSLLLVLVSAVAAGYALVPSTAAAQQESPGVQKVAAHQGSHHQRHGGQEKHHGRCAHMGHGGKGHGGHHGRGGMKGHHGAHHGKGKHHGKAQLLGPHWRTTLSPEQVLKLDTLRLEYAKLKAPLKAKAKAVKLELAVLATADTPDDKAIGARIDALMKLKHEMKEHKYRHIAARRKVLTAEQRPSFDMDVLKRAKRKGSKGY